MTGLLILPRHIIAEIQAERVKQLPRETGGFLIGLRRGPHIEVTDLTRQGPLDVATARSFTRSDPKHAREISSAWKASGALASIVGDWHSHPYGSAAPSPTDRKAWRTLARAVHRPVIGVIEAGEGMPGIYLVAKHGFNFGTRLHVKEEGEGFLAFSTSP